MALRACAVCGRRVPALARELGVCGPCIRRDPQRSAALVREAHARARRAFGLPVEAPRSEGGVRCGLCAWGCVIGEGERGFCGLRTVRGSRLVHLAGTPRRGLLRWYRDPLPTNCVADWVCPGHGRSGDQNLAVFYGSCTFDCMFCQNWQYRSMTAEPGGLTTAWELAAVANPRTFCVCFFGGDPSSQMPHALASGRLLAERGVRVCWETNGSMHPRFLERAVELSLSTGGIVKFDLKAMNEDLHVALTGASNRRTLENFARAASRIAERPDPPLVVASTLLVPGYVDAEEVGVIARFVASFDPGIPYALLALAPHFAMADLPRTSRRHAQQALEAARSAGLIRVCLGNVHLLART
ncbi:Pyruvate formate-lyase 1-activating enzyme [bacterium HR12]|nr:Pyruvate formate-lyase 1-activating enzyme [bacterium HR12]